MIVFAASNEFKFWFKHLRDMRARERIGARLVAAQTGNFGDCMPVGEGVSEMRIDVGAGYRVYFTRRDAIVYLLLSGGDKSSQQRDIRCALQMARELKASAL
jgi:putative addiction module killer protein